MVNLEWYRTFKAIYQNGTLTKAAQELLLSQPNVSVQLAALESYIGHALFIRLPRKMVPTDYAKQLYTQVVESIDNLERVEAEFKKSILNKNTTIKLGSPAEFFSVYLARNVSQLKSYLIVEYGLASDLIDKLVGNELDVAIITQRNATHEFLTYEPLLTESFNIVCSPEFDSSEFDSLVESADLEQIEKWLQAQQWYAYNSNLVLVRRFWRENFKKRPLLKLQAAIPDNNAILEAVANSNGLAVSSDLIAGRALKEGLVRVLWKGFQPATNELYIAYDKTKIEPKLLDEIRNFVNLGLQSFRDR